MMSCRDWADMGFFALCEPAKRVYSLLVAMVSCGPVSRRRTVHQVSKKWHEYCVTMPEFCSKLRFQIPREQQYPWEEVQKWIQKRAHLVRDLNFSFDEVEPGSASVHDSPEVGGLPLTALAFVNTCQMNIHE
jgi:hypothetical protein